MKRILIILFIGALLPAGVQAQQAYREGTRVILDLTVEAGMPAGAVTNVKKYTTPFTPSESAGTNNNEINSINSTLYHKLEIAPNDMNTNGGMDNTGIIMTTPWIDAFNMCRSSQHDGGGWRLPTQRELMVIYMFKPAFNSIFGSTSGSTGFSNADYWSSTEYSNEPQKSWFVNFENGNTNSKAKLYPSESRVRCVREVTTKLQPAGSVVLKSGRVAAKADASTSTMMWVEAMGIAARFHTEFFTENQPNYPFSPGITTGCSGYSESGYPAGSWRLPTRAELREMYDKKDEIGGFTPNSYWSATEGVATTAWAVSFNTGATNISPDKIMVRRVRCVRNP